MCDVNLSFCNDPEDGIAEEMARILTARDAPEEAWTWDGIWRLVFPGDHEVPDPGTPRLYLNASTMRMGVKLTTAQISSPLPSSLR